VLCWPVPGPSGCIVTSSQISEAKVRVKDTLRLTVSQSISLGVEPHLGLMTRYLLLFDSYFPDHMGRLLFIRLTFCCNKLVVSMYNIFTFYMLLNVRIYNICRHSNRAVCGMNRIRCAYAFSLCLCIPAFRLRSCDGLITGPRSPTVCGKWLRNWISGHGREWDGRAIEKVYNIYKTKKN
jgi:hypothetical protein